MDQRQLDRLLREQHGVISRRQARAFGIDAQWIRRRVRNGEWVRAHSSVFRVASVPRSWHGDLAAACLQTGGLASHRAAARLHGLERFGRPPIEVTVKPTWSRRMPPITTYRSSRFGAIRPVVRNGVPCTPLPLTVMDLGRVLTAKQLNSVVDQVLREGRSRPGDLYSAIAAFGTRARSGAGPLLRCLDRRDFEAQIPLSDWSIGTADALEARGLPRPAMEFVIDLGNGRCVHVDLVYPDAMLAIELESVRWHHNLEAFERDRARYRALAVAGWTVLPLTWRQFCHDIDEFAHQVGVLLERSPA